MDRVAVLETHIGEKLIIRANPSLDEVLSFVRVHNERYHSGRSGGPSGIPAFLIYKADFYPSEEEVEDPSKAEEIELPSL